MLTKFFFINYTYRIKRNMYINIIIKITEYVWRLRRFFANLPHCKMWILIRNWDPAAAPDATVRKS